MEALKSIVKRTPIVRDVARWVLRLIARLGAGSFDSADYWEKRYRKGKTSGSGSYRRLARFKADVLNRFVRDNHVHSVIELGCGDGAQLSLAEYPAYLGVDVSPTILEATARKFAADPTKSFKHLSELKSADRADLAMSLDVIYHLTEDSVFESHMRQLFSAARRFVIIYASNEEREAADVHVRHRKFTDWVDAHQANAVLKERITNPFPEDLDNPDDTSFADFYVYELG